MIRFADESVIRVSSGKGGNGCIAFRREKYVPKGGPSGGDGGRGGDVIFEIKQNMRTLVHLRYKRVFKAKNGRDGEGNQRFGANGEDCIIPLPPGCIIKDAETGELIYDFGDKTEGSFTFLKGGNGGWGNCHFKGPTNQAPRTALPGQEGETRSIKVELNIIADIGLVGFPNAGKSSLLDFFTNARPKIAPYPFTTKIPNLGVLHIDDERDIILADIPGIIEGASDGVGLGFRFLKHISRTAGLAFLIDLSDDNYLDAYTVLSKELAAFSEELAAKKRVIIATKLDLPDTKERLAELRKKLPDFTILGISVFNRWGLDEVKNAFIELCDSLTKKESDTTLEDEDHFMLADIEMPGYEQRDDFGATVSLSRKRKPKK
ncbi:GTPase ObgE [Treponema phagedenis]|uniref:GTPase Obg n=1 Tax=Treponema phagedenis TaxID=162 RepID=A0A0B7H107_TREPH|nr:GTPase ObgE [Treponema phagedenis]EFW38713.1 Obg family GTPase CgtA [Treponema phagedenis F0421]NVP25374.1 GTPase ObgE [Treponema phagedenis]QEJ94867.1 GTPase ObgE [Treponema phagedenis]QEJ97851.1 GTPase ObgE [Treponema phagedenis]QEK00767.1 GTPase ObgE [Treponema phagedenis]